MAVAVLLVAGCWPGDADVIETCVEEPGRCPPCQSEADCVFQGNSCHETVHCAHRDAELMFNQIGCNYEHDWPDDDECRCVDQVCRYQP